VRFVVSRLRWSLVALVALVASLVTVVPGTAQAAQAAPQAKLIVIVSGGGIVSGTGIQCPDDCMEMFPPFTQAVLTAPTHPAIGLQWGGRCAGTAGHMCVLTMDDDYTVTVTFVDCGTQNAQVLALTDELKQRTKATHKARNRLDRATTPAERAKAHKALRKAKKAQKKAETQLAAAQAVYNTCLGAAAGG
jgi:hypothetical protein